MCITYEKNKKMVIVPFFIYSFKCVAQSCIFLPDAIEHNRSLQSFKPTHSFSFILADILATGLVFSEFDSKFRVFFLQFWCGGATSNALMSNDVLSNAVYVALY